MPVSKDDITRWFDEAKANGAVRLLVVEDTFDKTGFPVHINKPEDFWTAYELYNKAENMNRVSAVYDMTQPKDEQMDEPRAWHVPPKEIA